MASLTTAWGALSGLSFTWLYSVSALMRSCSALASAAEKSTKVWVAALPFSPRFRISFFFA
ncbi:hypothetical protein D9M68_702180 [compost metagenome]